MKALVVQADKTAKVQEVPVPEIDEWEILVKVVAVALNPTDYLCTYHSTTARCTMLNTSNADIENVTNPGTISGCDWSGHIVKLGSKVSELHATNLKIGDHVAGFTHGGTYTDRGAFAEYVKATYDLCLKVPEGTLTHEEAAAASCG